METFYPRPLLRRASFYSLDSQGKLNDHNFKVPLPPHADESFTIEFAGYKEIFQEKDITMHKEMVISSIINGLVGYIFTQTTDVEGEINSLYTYERRILSQ